MIRRRVSCPNGHFFWCDEAKRTGLIRCPVDGCGLTFVPVSGGYEVGETKSPAAHETELHDRSHENVQSEEQAGVQLLDGPTTTQVLAELEKQRRRSPSWKRNLTTLAVSLVLFWALGLLRFGPSALGLLVVVLLIHEAGHLIAMRCFGYRDLRMIFIPLLGAAAIGTKTQAPSWQRAIIALAGPAPGILVGTALFTTWLYWDSQLVFYAGNLFLILNQFNLLPIFPLDGGHFFRDVVFSRTRLLEVLFRFLGVAACIAAALVLHSVVLGILGAFLFLGMIMTARIKTLARRADLTTLNTDDLAGEELSDQVARRIIPKVRAIMPESSSPKLVAQYTKLLWEHQRHATVRPPGARATMLLLGVYGLSWLLPIITVVALVILMGAGVLPEPTNELWLKIDEIRAVQ